VVVGAAPGVDVVVVGAVVVSTFFFAAVGVELHAAATSASAPIDTASVDHRTARLEKPPAPP
jgi:hypothetical protein